ncbi:MAG TPA: SHOCT domain-containing protein [Actinomycetota bacterium]
MMWGPDGWWWGWLVMVGFWVVIVLLVVWAVRGSGRNDHSDRADRSSAERTLDERFARGEIDVDEYEARREALHHPA